MDPAFSVDKDDLDVMALLRGKGYFSGDDGDLELSDLCKKGGGG